MSDIVIVMALLPILIVLVQIVLMAITLYKVMNMEMTQEERIKLGVQNAQRFAKRASKLVRGSVMTAFTNSFSKPAGQGQSSNRWSFHR